MLASSRFRSDSTAPGRPGRLSRRALLPLLGVLLLGGAALVSAATPSGPAASLGDRIHERFRVWVEDDAIRLRPIEGDPAIRSIALEDEEEEASVNGKAFTAETRARMASGLWP